MDDESADTFTSDYFVEKSQMCMLLLFLFVINILIENSQMCMLLLFHKLEICHVVFKFEHRKGQGERP